MKNEIVANCCRVCLTQTKKLRSLYKPIDEGDEPPNEMLHVITGIQVETLDEYESLPKNICKNCELSLNMAFEFRENALKTQQMIVTYIKELYGNNDAEDESNCEIYESPRSNFKTEYEAIMNLEPLDCVDALEEDMQILSNDEHKTALENKEELIDSANGVDYGNNEAKNENHFYKEIDSYTLKDLKENEDEIENENYSDHQQDEQNGAQDDNVEFQQAECNDIYELEVEYKDEHPEMVSAEEGEFICEKPTTKTKFAKSNRKKGFKILQKTLVKQADNNSKDNMKLIPRRGRKPNTNETGHICDICGNVFAKLGRMMEHRQRHDKEHKYSCEICDKKFFTRELLRKHMFSHSGGKPLKCRFCSRTFYYKSVRRAHEAVHEGLKPYVCEVCNKAFGYAHALKKHKLIHAEIKLYRCEYCNKDFRLQHHMKQHEMTKLHQNAVRFAQGGSVYEDCRELIAEQDLNADILFLEEVADDQSAGVS